MCYNLKILRLVNIEIVDCQDISNNYLTHLIIVSTLCLNFRFLNLKYLPSLNVIVIEQIRTMDIDGFIEQLSLYKHNIQKIIFVASENHVKHCNYQKQWDKIKTYCDDNNIKLKFK